MSAELVCAATDPASKHQAVRRNLAGLLEQVCDDPEVMEEALRLLGRQRPAGVIEAIERAQKRAAAGQIGGPW